MIKELSLSIGQLLGISTTIATLILIIIVIGLTLMV